MMDQTLTQQNFMTTVRYTITAVGAFAVAKGWISDETVNTLVGLAAIFGPLAWGMWVNYSKQQKLKQAAATGVAVGIAHAEDMSVNTVAPGAVTPGVAAELFSTYAPEKG